MSRTLWFFIGAGFGTWWATKKQWNVDCKIQQRSIAAPAVPSDQKPPMYNNTSEAGLVETTTYYQTPSYRDWEQERRQFTQHAEDTVVELSEATLSTILQATEALKAKMAEHRALRAEERRMEEERRRKQPRLV